MYTVQVLRQNSTSGEWTWSEGPALNKARYGHCVMQVQWSNPGAFANLGAHTLAGGSELNPFQMEDEQVLVVGGHDDQGVLDSVELMNLTGSWVGAGLFEGNLSIITLN